MALMSKKDLANLRATMNQRQETKEMTQRELAIYTCDHKDPNTGKLLINPSNGLRCSSCGRVINLNTIQDVEIATAVDTITNVIDQVKTFTNCNEETLYAYAEFQHLLNQLKACYKSASRVNYKSKDTVQGGTRSAVTQFTGMLPSSMAGKRNW